MTDEWKSGQPPASGWYIASTGRGSERVRYWWGRHWSAECWIGDTPADWAEARKSTGGSVGVEWLCPVEAPTDEGVDEIVADCKPTNPKDIVGVRKAPMSTVSAAVLAELGVAMLEGAAKYGRHNYRAVGVRSSVYYDATMRHLFAWWEGEDLDPDSGLSHVTKAIAGLVVLRDAMLQSKVEDDRPPPCEPFYVGLNEQAASTLDKHADKRPHHYTRGDGL